jgi:hypothetical protein
MRAPAVLSPRARLLCAVAGLAFLAGARSLWLHPERWAHVPFERGSRKLNAVIDGCTALVLLLAAGGEHWAQMVVLRLVVVFPRALIGALQERPWTK